jgi:hypothetical protein
MFFFVLAGFAKQFIFKKKDVPELFSLAVTLSVLWMVRAGSQLLFQIL